MLGENGVPVTPDWTPQAGNTCAACNATVNMCDVLYKVDHKPCCPSCTHEPQTFTKQSDKPIASRQVDELGCE